MNNLFVRVIGTGNAWPVLIGTEHPFYNRKNTNDLNNASFSIFKTNENDEIEWEVLIDAGFGTPQFLLNNYNRVPDAMVITHPHLDHIAGLDWIVQSYFKTKNRKPFPLYCSKLCWDNIINIFPHLNEIMEHKELFPSVTSQIKETKELTITGFPVYHGPNAKGAMLCLFEFDKSPDKKVVFTGDILCPLLRKNDFEKIKNASLLFTDSNNRFPYPNSNHWSFTSDNTIDKHKYLREWKQKISVSNLIRPHTANNSDPLTINYLNEIISEQYQKFNLPFSILDFIQITSPKKIVLVHYSGIEDKHYYNEKILSKNELLEWCNNNGKNHIFTVPKTGIIFQIN